MSRAPTMPTLEQLLKAAPMFARASVEVEAKLYLAGEGSDSGAEITPQMRDELLAKLAAGQFVAIDADILAYEQRADVANRNFVRFRDGGLIALGASGKGKPFLRDHRQYDSMSVAGRIMTSSTKKLADGQYEMRQRVRLSAAWAVELALRGLLFGVSIGWEPTGPVECSVHEAPIGTECYCWPGARLAEATDAKGNKKYEYNRSGTVRAQWIYTDAELIETSMCPIGAVKLAGFEGVRAALSAVGFDLDALEGFGALKSTTADATPNVGPTTPPAEMKMDPKDTEIADLKKRSTTLSALLFVAATLSEAHRAHAAKLSPTDYEAFLAKSAVERDAVLAATLAADPVVHKTKAGVEIRASHGPIALAQAKQLDDQAEVLDQQKLQLAAARDAEQLATLRAQVAKDIPALAGVEATKVAILGAVAAIKDEPTRTAALEMLRGANAAMTSLGTPKGANPGADPMPADKTSAFAALEKGLTAWCQANNKTGAMWTDGLAAFVSTSEGKALAAAYNATLA